MNLKIFPSLLVALSLFTACERVVDVKLNNAARKYVIEGNINTNGACTILLSATGNVSDNNNFEKISGAAVTVRDNSGAPVTLQEKEPGTYQTTIIKGRPGHKYALQVNIGEKAFSATSVMPSVIVWPDSVYFTSESLSSRERYIANVWYTDPTGKGNNYRFVQYVNERKENTVFVNNDNLSEGKAVAYPLFYLNDGNDISRDIKRGDTIRIELQCIDAPMYKYWYSLSTVTGSQLFSSASPANPVTNIEGGALGYFSAYTSRSIKVITLK